jgi:hypothetical protein
MSRLQTQLTALATMSPAQLRTEWQRVHKSPAPRVSADLLVRGIAWRLQEKALGGLSPAMLRELKRLAAVDGAEPVSTPVASTRDTLRPGTTLMRSWGGRNWSVLITEDGFVFEGRRYTALSQIAREITGAHWSGPRFFGLKAASSVREKVLTYA